MLNINIFHLIIYFLSCQSLEDPVQGERLQIVIDGYTDDSRTEYDGLLGMYQLFIFKHDSRTEYDGLLSMYQLFIFKHDSRTEYDGLLSMYLLFILKIVATYLIDVKKKNRIKQTNTN